MFGWFKKSYDVNSLDFVVLEAKLAYPSLFKDTASVLNHLYLVIGNGYEWADGAMRERCDDDKAGTVRKMLLDGVPQFVIRWVIARADKKRYKANRPPSLSRRTGSLYQRWVRWRILRKIEKEIEREDRNQESKHITPYPICEYSKIWVPADARPDWVAGAYEAARLALAYDSYNEQDTKNNRELAIKAIERLDKMFGCLTRPQVYRETLC